MAWYGPGSQAFSVTVTTSGLTFTKSKILTDYYPILPSTSPSSNTKKKI